MRQGILVSVLALVCIAAPAVAAKKAPTTTAPVVATRVTPAQPSQAGPNRIGVLIFFDFNPGSQALFKQLAVWARGLGRPVVLDREPTVTGSGPVPLARAFVVARTLGVTDAVLPKLFQLAPTLPKMNRPGADRQAELNKVHAAIAKVFAAAGINRIEFSAAWNSAAADAGVIRARAMTGRFQVAQTPIVVVDGLWKLIPGSGASAGDIVAMLERKVTAAAARIAANR